MTSSAGIEILQHSNEILITNNGNSIRIKIENQLMQILSLLAEYEGELVEKQLFIDRIWVGNNFSGDAALTKNIFKLREIFKSNGIDNKIGIETIPKKGYRLLIKPGNEPAKNKAINYNKALLIPGAILVFLCIVFFIYRSNSTVDKTIPVMIITGKDTVIQPGNKKVQIINIDTSANKLVNIDSISEILK